MTAISTSRLRWAADLAAAGVIVTLALLADAYVDQRLLHAAQALTLPVAVVRALLFGAPFAAGLMVQRSRLWRSRRALVGT